MPVFRQILECQLERELKEPRRGSLENLPELRGRDIVLRQEEIGVVRYVETFGAELESDLLANREIPKDGEIDIRHPGTADDVPALVAELARLRHRIEPLKCRAADPLIWRMRPSIGIGNQVGTARIEPANFRRAALKRNVAAVVHSERRSR